ncbi:terpene cyclase/mutase family protein [Amycolatopsis sp. K13G38]|uniref:Terpene cyclase/mutase family protein n=1 Tax=Amycolatopsis acididurans TaxID=2724524 RepID=A0ABX1IZ86_9PSEU|nr:prenyltransferase/squalene oxidase repeat-containing protein [Amycolatopsis acididurans]NKQ52759.1 terpene cyclase/mutase family protein [Amycolatopsis acididurans]
MNLTNLAQRLTTEMAADPCGDFSPSVYESARLVTVAPALAGHDGRIRFLLDQQSATGDWGGPGGYGLLPTLSATEALLAELARTRAPHVAVAAQRGLRALFAKSGPDKEGALPDTVAVELLVPWLTGEINARLAALETKPLPGLRFWPDGQRLSCPPGCYPDLLAALREAATAGHPLPEKLGHSLEMLGPSARGATFVTPTEFGAGCSPASTAAWFGTHATNGNAHAGMRFLHRLQARHGGPVPVAAPLDVFERAWVLATFTDAGLAVTVPPGVVRGLRAAFTASGVPGGAGLPTDADDTATALHALANLGVPQPLDPLWEYHTGDHFSTYPDERTPSVTTNAHVLQAFAAQPATGPREARTMRELSHWLSARQHDDGSWSDKWHASPYYATVCCFTALTRCPESTAAARKAVRWVLATQRDDGSWGRWQGTVEETAYAVQILLRAGDPAAEEAAARGCAYLLDAGNDVHPPLWHDKDLYTPARIVRAETIAALHLAGTQPRVAALVARSRPTRARRTA